VTLWHGAPNVLIRPCRIHRFSVDILGYIDIQSTDHIADAHPVYMLACLTEYP